MNQRTAEKALATPFPQRFTGTFEDDGTRSSAVGRSCPLKLVSLEAS
jgi:hypothetical protein